MSYVCQLETYKNYIKQTGSDNDRFKQIEKKSSSTCYIFTIIVLHVRRLNTHAVQLQSLINNNMQFP